MQSYSPPRSIQVFGLLFSLCGVVDAKRGIPIVFCSGENCPVIIGSIVAVLAIICFIICITKGIAENRKKENEGLLKLFMIKLAAANLSQAEQTKKLQSLRAKMEAPGMTNEKVKDVIEEAIADLPLAKSNKNNNTDEEMGSPSAGASAADKESGNNVKEL